MSRDKTRLALFTIGFALAGQAAGPHAARADELRSEAQARQDETDMVITREEIEAYDRRMALIAGKARVAAAKPERVRSVDKSLEELMMDALPSKPLLSKETPIAAPALEIKIGRAVIKPSAPRPASPLSPVACRGLERAAQLEARIQYDTFAPVLEDEVELAAERFAKLVSSLGPREQRALHAFIHLGFAEALTRGILDSRARSAGVPVTFRFDHSLGVPSLMAQFEIRDSKHSGTTFEFPLSDGMVGKPELASELKEVALKQAVTRSLLSDEPERSGRTVQSRSDYLAMLAGSAEGCDLSRSSRRTGEIASAAAISQRHDRRAASEPVPEPRARAEHAVSSGMPAWSAMAQ